MHKNAHNVKGGKFGMLSAINPVSSNHRGVYWLFYCECGNYVEKQIVNINRSIKGGYTPSCGCLTSQLRSGASRRHGMTDHPVWLAWKCMLERCERTSHLSWDNYGGRGISVCSEWHVFENFFKDMGKEWRPTLSLDRIDNNGSYAPDNCRWATRKQQGRNKRNNIIISANGKTMTLPEWAEQIGISKRTLYSRKYSGWADDRIINQPKRVFLKKE